MDNPICATQWQSSVSKKRSVGNYGKFTDLEELLSNERGFWKGILWLSGSCDVLGFGWGFLRWYYLLPKKSLLNPKKALKIHENPLTFLKLLISLQKASSYPPKMSLKSTIFPRIWSLKKIYKNHPNSKKSINISILMWTQWYFKRLNGITRTLHKDYRGKQ